MNKIEEIIEDIGKRILVGEEPDREEFKKLIQIKVPADIYLLMDWARKIRLKRAPEGMELCAIINAKSGRCSEDCKFCAQSKYHNAKIEVYPLLSQEKILSVGKEVERDGIHRFSIVTSGKGIKDEKDPTPLLDAIYTLKENLKIKLCASLGIISEEMAKRLKSMGISTYHHNIEAPKSLYSKICTTHSYEERIATIKAAKRAGLRICSGGIWGLGETLTERLEMAFELKEIGVDSVALNFITPIKGTPMENHPPLSPLSALKWVAIYRFILPDIDIRVCGGRTFTMGRLDILLPFAGISGLMTGNYLTTKGRDPEEDKNILKSIGIRLRKE